VPAIDRRRFLIGSLGAAGAVALGVACTSDDDGDGSPGGSDSEGDEVATAATILAAPGTAGLVDEQAWQARVDGYLAFATTEPHSASVTGIAAHLIQARRDPGHTWPVEAVTIESLRDTFDMIDAWEDTRDFRIMYLHWLLALGRGETPMTTLSPEVLEAIETRLVDNRYRYDDPLPDDRIDNLWFWSENHRIITLTCEYLAGQALPDRTFTITGLTGTEHLERSKGPILEWVRERAELGFFEWHSNVYMLKNVTPLISLVELADDPEVVQAAGMALDLCLVDMAAHTQRGAYAAPRGRTYKKDKMTARHEDTFGTAKLVFADTDVEYQSTADGGATYLCAAQRYRPPQVVLEIATTDDTTVVRERHGVHVDAGAPVSDDIEAPHGKDFEDPANLPFWWSLGAVGMWQTARVSVAEADEHRLWDTELFTQIKALADLNGRDPERIRDWLQQNHAIVNFGFLGEGNTYAWRSPEVTLATVVDHRAGEMRDQVHAWQAQIDADALVFTTHPLTEPAASTDWSEDPSPGYWTGEASMPRSAQHERTAIHIYLPAWDESTDALLWTVFPYRDLTHAYVPQERFDQVSQVGHWTVASKDGGHIALWSWRAPTWREVDPATEATDGMTQPFDLVALGGADNVWIVEVGTAADGDHDAFAAAVSAAEPDVTRGADGFEVAWSSPSSGAVTFGSDAPFTVEGSEVALSGFPRHESPWGTVEHLATTYDLAAGSSRLGLDFDRATRTLA
jgi:hypothetical protein